jgi:hypothetical protein
MMTLPKIEDSKNEFKGVIINKIIKNTDKPRHIHMFCVDLANSTTVIEEDIVKIYLYFIFYKYI